MLRKYHIGTQHLKCNADTPHAHKVEDVYRLILKHLRPIETVLAITDGQSDIINVAHGTDATRPRVRYGKLWLEVQVLVLIYLGHFRLLVMFIQYTCPCCFLNTIIGRLCIEIYCSDQPVMQTLTVIWVEFFVYLENEQRYSSLVTLPLHLSPSKQVIYSQNSLFVYVHPSFSSYIRKKIFLASVCPGIFAMSHAFFCILCMRCSSMILTSYSFPSHVWIIANELLLQRVLHCPLFNVH